MDDDTLHTQRTDIEKCISELGETLLSEPSGVSGFSKIVHHVHKVIKSFIQLGNYYAIELRKKCNELEIKNREIKELSWKLRQVELHVAQQLRDRDAECLNTDTSSNEIGKAKEQQGKLAASNGSFSQLLKDQTQFQQLSLHEPIMKSVGTQVSLDKASEITQQRLVQEQIGTDESRGPNKFAPL